LIAQARQTASMRETKVYGLFIERVERVFRLAQFRDEPGCLPLQDDFGIATLVVDGKAVQKHVNKADRVAHEDKKCDLLPLHRDSPSSQAASRGRLCLI
jgi:hypothetical protein